MIFTGSHSIRIRKRYSLLCTWAGPAHSQRERIVLEGEVADPSNPPSGCYFHPRCRYAQERCQQETPDLRSVADSRFVACHFAEELDLAGAGTP